ncbi:MAG: LysM peptidoglycan-binding domain-containing protein [Acetobacteraceae bacterium]|nr:LysM peptidoglycan-binding domain-containing protein [Acetobacteraceae bacterium]
MRMGEGPEGSRGGSGVPPRAGDSASLAHLAQSAAMSRAALLAYGGRLAQAEALLLPMAADVRASPAVLDLLARVYAQQGRLDGARSLWARALDGDPGNPRYRGALERCDRLQRAGRPVRWWLWSSLGRLGAAVVIVALLGALGAVGLRAGGEVRALRQEVAGLAALASAEGRPAGTVASPEASSGPPAEVPMAQGLRARVEEAVASIQGLGPLDIRVTEEGGVVRLAGRVPTLWARYLVEAEAGAVPGVAALDLRGLRVVGTCVVQPGDTLWSIAARVYGTPEAWLKLARANRVPPPYVVCPGQVLEVPLEGGP